MLLVGSYDAILLSTLLSHSPLGTIQGAQFMTLNNIGAECLKAHCSMYESHLLHVPGYLQGDMWQPVFACNIHGAIRWVC